MALDRPASGRIFSGQLIRDNPGIGRPDKINIVFGRMIRQRGKFRTPGTFRTQVITAGTSDVQDFLNYLSGMLLSKVAWAGSGELTQCLVPGCDPLVDAWRAEEG